MENLKCPAMNVTLYRVMVAGLSSSPNLTVPVH